jgi:DNA replication and repair protein RecF
MFLKRLVLSNFRNFKGLSWHPHKGINIITGENAQGKTNLLEAIGYCTTGTSFRTFREKEMITGDVNELHNDIKMQINAQLEINGLNNDISVTLSEKYNADFRLNGLKQKKNKLFQPVMSVSFTPVDLDLIRGNPSGRRRWLDAEVCPFDSLYLYNLQNYNRVLSQKNILLKEKIKTTGFKELFETFNVQLINYGSRIIYIRLIQLGKLASVLKDVYREITRGKEDIYYKYLSSVPLGDKLDIESIAGCFTGAVAARAQEEIASRQALVGPHRDDLQFYISGMDARRYCSRGQQRSAVLSLKMSVIKLYNREYGNYPLLLMDDVMMELDEARQAGMAGLFALPQQSFITATAVPDNLPGNFKVAKIANGQLIEGG